MRHSRRVPQPVWHAVSAIALAAYTLGSLAIVFRLAGPAAFGVWSVLMALRGMVAFVEAGLALGVARDVALHERDDPDALGRVAAARLLYTLFALGIVALTAAAALLDFGDLLRVSDAEADAALLATLLVGCEAAAILGGSPLLAIVRGRQRFDVLAYGSAANAVGGLFLLAVLTSLFGIVGAAAAVLITRVLVILGYRIWVARDSPAILRMADRTRHLRDVLRFVVPVWSISVGTQVGLRTQVPIIAAYLGAVAAGQFSAGQTLATLAAGLLWVVLDTAFPSLAQAPREEAAQRVRVIAFVGTLIGALGFGTLALHPGPLLTFWLGEAPSLAQDVMLIYAAAWMINVPAHVLTVAAMARGRHRIVAPVVVAEAIAIFALSVALADRLGGVGPAVATLVVFAVSNLVIIPSVLIPRLSVRPTALAWAVASGTCIGLAAAVLIRFVLSFADLPPVFEVVGIGVAVAVPVLVLLRHPTVRRSLG